MKILQKNMGLYLLIVVSAVFLPVHILSGAKKLPLHALILDQTISTQDKLERMQDLLSHESININAQDANKKTALNLATFYNAKPIIIQFFIANKADVNLPDLFNETPLHNAIRNEELVTARMLLQAGADKNFKNDTGETPMDLARSPKTIALFGLAE